MWTAHPKNNSPKTKKLTSPRRRVIFFSSCLFFFCWFESWWESTYNSSSWIVQVSIQSNCCKYQWLNMYSVHFSIFRIMQNHFVHFKQWSRRRDKSPQLIITHYLMLAVFISVRKQLQVFRDIDSGSFLTIERLCVLTKSQVGEGWLL